MKLFRRPNRATIVRTIEIVVVVGVAWNVYWLWQNVQWQSDYTFRTGEISGDRMTAIEDRIRTLEQAAPAGE